MEALKQQILAQEYMNNLSETLDQLNLASTTACMHNITVIYVLKQ